VPTLKEQITDLASRAKHASRVLASMSSEAKDGVLQRVSAELRGPARASIMEANRLDVADGEAAGLGSAVLDRLRLDETRLDAVADAVDHVVSLPDPVGAVDAMRRLPNGLLVGRMRVPLGVVAMIYESRPNVTADAAALCIKSGNAAILRGGREAFRSNQAIAAAFTRALTEAHLPPEAAQLVPTTEREAMLHLIQLDDLVDLVIPRGGEALIRFVAEHARVPVIRHYKGVCHVYVDGEADLDMAEAVAINSKTHRTGVCNAMETLLVDAECADAFVPRVTAALLARGVELRGDVETRERAPDVAEATEEDWSTEYLDAILSIRVVDGIDGALDHVARYGSNHTESIVTGSYARAQRWLREVDASLVLVNASTRFNDGGELGLGAEIGISTSKLHAYGAMGLEELCTRKWIAYGDGQVRS
jgi:glutamate-5-semialdehyde dehydrogenase